MSLAIILLFAAQFLPVVLMLLFFLFLLEGMLLKVPFVPVSGRILKDISKSLEVKANSVVYDLGSGEGKVLFALAKEKPSARYIGFELRFTPFYLSKVRTILAGTKVELYRRDFFKEDLSGATHIFMYLFPPVMGKLLEKLEKELKPGTRVVSASFELPGKEPIKIIPIEGKGLVKTLYVYEF